MAIIEIDFSLSYDINFEMTVASNEDIYCRRCGMLPTPKDPRPVEDFLLRQIVRTIVSFLYFLTPIFTNIRRCSFLLAPSRADDRY